MKDFFSPSSVAVIGVSPRRWNLGKEIARNLLEFGFNGVIHLVGREGGVIFGHKIHDSLDEIHEPVDLAVILTPAKTIPEIMTQCGEKGIRRVVIESGGFGELDEGGKELGEELRRIARTHGMRFVGPNCIGIMNSENGLATPFTTMRNVFPKGTTSIVAQSGGVALTFLNMFQGEQIGFSKFAAIGNKLDADESDFLEYLLEDPQTDVVCLYLESIKNGRRLCDLARKSAKPIVVHKANTSPMSGTIAMSHTEALVNDDMVVEAALKQSAIARFRDMQNYLDFVKVLQLPEMKGRNLAIVSRSGGHAVIAADAAYQHGFQLPMFSESFLKEIRQQVRADVIKLGNPLDLGDLFDFEVYVRIIDHTLRQENIDGVLFLQTYFAAIEGEASRKLLQEAAALVGKYNKPVAMCVFTEQFELSRLHRELDFPIFLSPERAVRALDASMKRVRTRKLIEEVERNPEPAPSYDRAAIRDILQTAADENRDPLVHEALAIAKALGLAVPEFALVDRTDVLDEALKSVPGPYAIKLVATAASHKSDVGGVALGIPDALAARTVVLHMMEGFGSDPAIGFKGILVQRMAGTPEGTMELIAGGKQDLQFGPVVLLGYGGILVEVMGKTSLRLAPISGLEADSMIEELPGSEMFHGIRGRAPMDLPSLRDVIVRIADLMASFPDIRSMELNPILVSSSGVTAVDARVVTV